MLVKFRITLRVWLGAERCKGVNSVVYMSDNLIYTQQTMLAQGIDETIIIEVGFGVRSRYYQI